MIDSCSFTVTNSNLWHFSCFSEWKKKCWTGLDILPEKKRWRFLEYSFLNVPGSFTFLCELSPENKRNCYQHHVSWTVRLISCYINGQHWNLGMFVTFHSVVALLVDNVIGHWLPRSQYSHSAGNELLRWMYHLSTCIHLKYGRPWAQTQSVLRDTPTRGTTRWSLTHDTLFVWGLTDFPRFS